MRERKAVPPSSRPFSHALSPDPSPDPSPGGLWLSFLLLVLLNAFLSWAPCSLSCRLEVFVIGLLPLFIYISRHPFSNNPGLPWEEETLPPLSNRVAFLLLFLASGIRLYKLASIPFWPESDEGTNFFLASQLNQKWHWNFYFNYNHLPPLFFWLSAFFFRIFPPSLFSFWLFPSLASLVALVLDYIACRFFFSRSFSVLVALGWAFSFWPLYTSHFGIPPVLVPVFQFASLALLGLCLKNKSKRFLKIKLIFLGLVLGAGFYTFFSWPLIALTLLIAAGFSLRSIPKSTPSFLWAALPAFAVTIPLWLARFDLPHNFDHFKGRWVFQDGFNWADYLRTSGSYVTALFWGPSASLHYHAYKPFWGGFLNPLLDALFFIGVFEMARKRRQPLIQWVTGSFFLLLLPAFLTNNLEMFRVTGVLPLLFFGVALGTQVLLKTLKPPKRVFFLAFFWLCSFGLDFYHLAVVYPSFWKNLPVESWGPYGMQRPCYDAYQTLSRKQEADGPGLILNNFTVPLETDPKEHSLTLACFPFDAGRNPRLGPDKARWAAFFFETPDLPFLRERFPQADCFDLGPALYSTPAWYSTIAYTTPNHRYFMMVVPLTPQTTGIFQRWSQANLFLQEILYESLDPVDSHFRESIHAHLFGHHWLFQDDPFLESHFWALVEENLRAADQPPERILSAIQWGLKKGYPYAEKYRALGNLLLQTGQSARARQAFITAGRLDPAYRLAPQALEESGLSEKKPAPGKAVPPRP